jgi:hypothetical protein
MCGFDVMGSPIALLPNTISTAQMFYGRTCHGLIEDYVLNLVSGWKLLLAWIKRRLCVLRRCFAVSRKASFEFPQARALLPYALS